MAPLKILICGGGCAGPALAFWLARNGHQVVVVERFPVLRASGAQIDLREQGIETVKRMGLLDAVRTKLVDEEGLSFVDSHGNIKGTIMANKSGKGAQSLTSEYEIMRGDVTVDRFEQDENRVLAYFSDGSNDTFDLLVGADGQGSRIRKAILPPDAPEPYRRLGIYMAYWFVPRIAADNNIRKSYLSPGGRWIMHRTHSSTEGQAYFILRDDSPETSSMPRSSVETQKDFWTQKFRGAGWQTDRFLEAMQTTENFYCQEVVQVKTERWSKGRVVLLGDAAHCPSPFSGMGTTASFVGAYVLAGEICRNPDDLPLAFANYDEKLRPFVNEVQKLNIKLLRLAIPQKQWAISLIHFVVWLLCLLRIPDLISRFSSEERGGWKLPDYPEMKLG
ncbi:hypothetical protein G7046_g7105 [Stylonectria norvegica]|nr:hypothetical protein G7046_g7105 [Stylonectria norvegica]